MRSKSRFLRLWDRRHGDVASDAAKQPVPHSTWRGAATRFFMVSISSPARWMQQQQLRASRNYAAKPAGGDVRSFGIEAHKDWRSASVAAEPGLRLEQIRGRLMVEKSLNASVWTTCTRCDSARPPGGDKVQSVQTWRKPGARLGGKSAATSRAKRSRTDNFVWTAP
jgi:hypothetical protein